MYTVQQILNVLGSGNKFTIGIDVNSLSWRSKPWRVVPATMRPTLGQPPSQR